MSINYSIINCPLGKLFIFDKQGSLYFSCFQEDLGHWKKKFPELTNAKKEKTSLTKFIENKLKTYFKTGRLNTLGLKFYPHGSSFQQSVWIKLRDIKDRQTLNYSELAKKIKKTSAVRAVATACGKNPFILFVPCHRVVGKNGLGGFSAGMWRKEYLLKLETD